MKPIKSLLFGLCFVLNAGQAFAANVGWTALAPITPPVGTGRTFFVSDPYNTAINAANIAVLPSDYTVYNPSAPVSPVANHTLFATLQAAATATAPGDTVLLMNGTFEPVITPAPNPKGSYGSILVAANSGTASNYITYAAYPGMHPVVTEQNNTWAYDIVTISGSYIVMEGFEIVGQGPLATLGFARATADAEAITQAGLVAAGASQGNFPSSEGKDLDDGACIYASQVSHIYIANMLLHDCAAAGVNVQYGDYIVLEANTAYNTSYWTMFDTSGLAIHYGWNTDTSTVYKNFVLDNLTYNNANAIEDEANIFTNLSATPPAALPTPTDGNGIIIDTMNTTNPNTGVYTGRTLVAGNVSYGNGGSGMHSYLSSHVDIVNNTAFMNETCPVFGSTCGPYPVGLPGGQIKADNSADVTVEDNIAVAPAGKPAMQIQYDTTAIPEGNNVLWTTGGPPVLSTGYTPGSSDVLAQPLFVNAAGNNFTAAPGSPALTAGTPFSNTAAGLSSITNLLPQISGTIAGAVP